MNITDPDIQESITHLTLQPLLPICVGALEDWKRSTVFKPSQAYVLHRLEHENVFVWADNDKIQDALVDLLEAAAIRIGGVKEVRLTIGLRGLNHCRIEIAMRDPMTGGNPLPRPDSTQRVRISARLRRACQMVSLHGGFVSFPRNPPQIYAVEVHLLCME